jgi:hypothetical protein
VISREANGDRAAKRSTEGDDLGLVDVVTLKVQVVQRRLTSSQQPTSQKRRLGHHCAVC